MFKIATDFVEKPTLIVYCDRKCSASAAGFVEPGKEGDPEVQTDFVRSLAQKGWVIKLDEHVCPEHAAKDRADASGIVIPRGAHL